MNSPSIIITEKSIVMMLDGKTHVVTKAHPNYDKIKERIIAKDYEDILSLIDLPKVLNDFGSGEVVVKDGVIEYQGEALHGAIVDRIFKMIEEGFDVKPMVLFLENLLLNPSKRALDELYGFLEACSLPITDDGHFLAYKKVRKHSDGNLYDIYTGKLLNNVGEVREVRRNQVDEDRFNTCSYGLHFCSQSYLPQFGAGSGDVVVIVKINPKDVVAIPVDYNNAKGRTCRYEVVSEHELSDYEFPNVVDSRFSSDENDYDEDDYNEEDDWDEEGNYIYDDDTYAEYETGYAAGKAKAIRHNARGWGVETQRSESNHDLGYITAYRTYRNTGLPETEPVKVKTPRKSTGIRDPKTGRYLSKVAVAPVAAPQVRAFTKNPTTGLLEAVQPTRAIRDPKTGRYLPRV